VEERVIAVSGPMSRSVLVSKVYDIGFGEWVGESGHSSRLALCPMCDPKPPTIFFIPET